MFDSGILSILLSFIFSQVRTGVQGDAKPGFVRWNACLCSLDASDLIPSPPFPPPFSAPQIVLINSILLSKHRRILHDLAQELTFGSFAFICLADLVCWRVPLLSRCGVSLSCHNH